MEVGHDCGHYLGGGHYYPILLTQKFYNLYLYDLNINMYPLNYLHKYPKFWDSVWSEGRIPDLDGVF